MCMWLSVIGRHRCRSTDGMRKGCATKRSDAGLGGGGIGKIVVLGAKYCLFQRED